MILVHRKGKAHFQFHKVQFRGVEGVLYAVWDTDFQFHKVQFRAELSMALGAIKLSFNSTRSNSEQADLQQQPTHPGLSIPKVQFRALRPPQ